MLDKLLEDDRIEIAAISGASAGAMNAVVLAHGIAIDMLDIVDYNGGVLGLAGDDAHAAMAAATRSNLRIYPIDPRGLTSSAVSLAAKGAFQSLGAATGGFALVDQEYAHAAVAAASRANVSWYNIDPSGVVGSGSDPIAELMGGFHHPGGNDYAKTFERLVNETSTYCVLGFNSDIRRKQGRTTSSKPGSRGRPEGAVPDRVRRAARIPRRSATLWVHDPVGNSLSDARTATGTARRKSNPHGYDSSASL
jgi:hypothetical protein